MLVYITSTSNDLIIHYPVILDDKQVLNTRLETLGLVTVDEFDDFLMKTLDSTDVRGSLEGLRDELLEELYTQLGGDGEDGAKNDNFDGNDVENERHDGT
jgi:hypothetical protein